MCIQRIHSHPVLETPAVNAFHFTRNGTPLDRQAGKNVVIGRLADGINVFDHFNDQN